MIAPAAAEARISAPVFFACITRTPSASSGGARRPTGSGVTQARSIAWPPTMPTGPAAVAIVCDHAELARHDAGSLVRGSRASRANASVSRPSPARMAMPSPATTCSVGRPRRIVSLSMAGRSS